MNLKLERNFYLSDFEGKLLVIYIWLNILDLVQWIDNTLSQLNTYFQNTNKSREIGVF